MLCSLETQDDLELPMRSNVRLKIIAIVAPIFPILIAFFVLSQSTHQQIETLRDWVDHTVEVTNQISGLLSDMQDAEISQLRFIITNDEPLLETYHSAIKKTELRLTNLFELTSDNPIQQQHLRRLNLLIQEKLVVLQQAIALTRTHHLQAAVDILSQKTGKVLMDDIRHTIVTMTNEEARLLVLRKSEFQKSTAHRYKIEAILIVGFILTCLVTILLLIRSLVAPLHALTKTAAALTRGDYSARVTRVSNDEFGSLAETFNQMAAAMQLRIKEIENKGNRLQAIIETSVEGIITINNHGIVETINSTAVEMFGYQEEEVIGQNIKMLMPEPYHSEHDGYLQNYRETGEKKIIGIGREVSGRRKDGSVFPMELAVSEVVTTDQQIFSGLVRDITERKNFEAALRSSETRYRSVIDAALDGIMTINECGIVASMNPAAERIFGYKKSEVIGCNIKMLMPEPYHSEHDGYLQNYRETGEKKIIGIGREVSGRRKDGSVFPMELAVSEIATDDKPIFMGLVRDITEMKQVEEMQSKFSAIIESSDDAIISKTLDGIITSWNTAAEKIFGYSAQEVIGHPMSIIIPPERLEEEPKILRQIASGGRIEHFETVRRTKAGKLIDISATLSPIKNKAGKIIGVSKIARDISERKKIDQMKNEFISTVSHELRTPLTSIRGSLGLISGGAVGELPAPAKAMLKIAGNNTERLLLLINDILDIQKIESGQMVFKFSGLMIMPFVKQSLIDNFAYAEQHHVKFVIVKELNDVQVYADKDRMMQVMANLLSNAAKFSPDNDTVEISVAYHNTDFLRISVTDHGPGIPVDFQPKLFDKFTQSDSSDTRQKGGTGLGLSITKVIVEKHGGYIGFVSHKDIGTTFFVDLPALMGDKLENNTMVDNLEKINTASVLIVEDDPDVAALIKIMLAQGGYDSDIAYDAGDARQKLQNKPGQYKAVTLDISLSGEDGISLLKSIRQEPNTNTVPVIIVSAKANESKRLLNGSAVGVVDWLQKPIDHPRLINIVKHIVDSKLLPRVLHVEDEADIHAVVSAMLNDHCDLSWAKTLAAGKELLESKKFDLVLLDIGLPDGSGLDLLKIIEHCVTPPKVVIFSANDVTEEFASKVSAVLIKSETDNLKLVEMIDAVLKKNNLNITADDK